MSHPGCQKKSQIDCHPVSVDLSRTTWVERELINQLARNACGSQRTKATIKYRDKHRTSPRLRRNISIMATVSFVTAPFLEDWEVWRTFLLPLLLGIFGPGVNVSVRVSFMGQIDLFKKYSFTIGMCAKNTLKKQTKN